MVRTLLPHASAGTPKDAQALSPLNPRAENPRTGRSQGRARALGPRADTSPLRRGMREETVDDKLHHFSAGAVVSHQTIARNLGRLAQMSHGQIARTLLNRDVHAQTQRVAHSHDTVLMLADRGNKLHALGLAQAHDDRLRKILGADASDILLHFTAAGHEVVAVAGYGSGDATLATAGTVRRAQEGSLAAPPAWLLARNLGKEAAAATVAGNPLASAASRLLADVGATAHVLDRGQRLAYFPRDVAALQRAIGADEQRHIGTTYGLVSWSPKALTDAAASSSDAKPQRAGHATDDAGFAAQQWEALQGRAGLAQAVRLTLAPAARAQRQEVRRLAHRSQVLPRLMPMGRKPIPPSRWPNENPVHLFRDTPANRALFAAEDAAAHNALVASLNLDQDKRLQAVPAATNLYFADAF